MPTGSSGDGSPPNATSRNPSGAEEARVRHLGEVVILGRDPEHRHRLAAGALQALGDERRAGHLGQRVERTAEEPRLLTGDDHQRVGLGETTSELAARADDRRTRWRARGRRRSSRARRAALRDAAAHPAWRRRAAPTDRGARRARSRERARRRSARTRGGGGRRWMSAARSRARASYVRRAVPSSCRCGEVPYNASDGRHAAPSTILNQRSKSFDLEWIDVPAGSFLMGGGPRAEENPPHRVTVAAFRLARAPVTRAEYQAFLDATGHEAPPFWSEPQFQAPRLPAVGTVVGRRDGVLPLDRGRLRATRSDCRPRPSGSAPPRPIATRSTRGATAARRQVPDYERRWIAGPEPVDLYPSPHPWGFLGLGENVHEWCADWYDADYYQVSPPVDPRGPEEGRRRASRGGSWRHDIKVTRCAARSSIPPRMRYADYGFRLRARRRICSASTRRAGTSPPPPSPRACASRSRPR